MARTINPLRKELVKREYIRTGGNGYKALKAGGLKESTARHYVGPKNTLLNLVEKEIEEELKHSDITPDLLVKRFEEDRKLALAKKDIATATRVDELLAKSIAMLTDKVENKSTLVVKSEEKEELNRLRGNLLPHIN